MAMTDKELIAQIRKCRLADLSDGMDALGLVNAGSMSPEMRPIRPGIEFAGFAWTIKLLPAPPGQKFEACRTVEEYHRKNGEWLSSPYTFDKILQNEDMTDKVLVIDQEGIAAGLLGSDNMLKYKLKGVVGAVIDGGGCRDSYECNLQQVNVFSTKRTFHHVTGRLVHGGVNIPIQCAGVTVHPGDVVCADDDGVLVIPRNRAEEVLMFALDILAKDQKSRSKSYELLGMEKDASLERLSR
jgi:regulator of RNase E activity RraA